MNAPREEKRVASDEDGINSRLHEGGESGVDLVLGAGFADVQPQTKRFHRRLHVGHLGRDFGFPGLTRNPIVRTCGNSSRSSSSPLRGHGIAQPADPRHVSARTIQAGHQAELHRVAAGGEHNGNDRCRSLGGNSRRGDAGGGDDRNLTTDQIGGERRQLVILALRPAILDRDIAALDIADCSEAIPERGQERGKRGRRKSTEIADDRH